MLLVVKKYFILLTLTFVIIISSSFVFTSSHSSTLVLNPGSDSGVKGDNITNRTNPSFDITINSDIIGFVFKAGGVTFTDRSHAVSSGLKFTFQTTAIGLGGTPSFNLNGTNVIEFCGYQTGGNFLDCGSASDFSSVSITMDTTAPEITISGPIDITETLLTYSALFADNHGLNISSLKYKIKSEIDVASCKSSTGANAYTNESKIIVPRENNLSKVICFFGDDTAGNTGGAVSSTIVATYSNATSNLLTAPDLLASSDLGDEDDDNVTNAESISISIDGVYPDTTQVIFIATSPSQVDRISDGTATSISNGLATTSFPGLPEGVWSITAKQVINGVSSPSPSPALLVTIDRTPPTLTLGAITYTGEEEVGGIKYLNTGDTITIPITFVGTSLTSVPILFFYNIGSEGGSAAATSHPASSTIDSEIEYTLTINEGYNALPGNFRYSTAASRVYDLAGNFTSVSTVINDANIDTTSPAAITATVAHSGDTSDNSATNQALPVSVFGVEEGASWFYRLNGGEVVDGDTIGGDSFIPAGATAFDNLADGNHSLVIYQQDIAGNIGVESTTSFTIDTEPIVVTLALVEDTGSSSTDKITSNPSIRITEAGGATELNASANEWRYRIGTTGSFIRGTTGAHSNAFTIPTSAFTEGENIQVFVKTIDEAGNETPSPFTQFIIVGYDATPPTVTIAVPTFSSTESIFSANFVGTRGGSSDLDTSSLKYKITSNNNLESCKTATDGISYTNNAPLPIPLAGNAGNFVCFYGADITGNVIAAVSMSIFSAPDLLDSSDSGDSDDNITNAENINILVTGVITSVTNVVFTATKQGETPIILVGDISDNSARATFTTLSDGAWSITAKQTIGGIDFLSPELNIIIDKTPPVITSVTFVSSNGNTAFAKSGDTITISGVTNEEAKLSGIFAGLSLNCSSAFSTTINCNLELTNGALESSNAQTTLILTDKAGNTQTQTILSQIQVDATAPTATYKVLNEVVGVNDEVVVDVSITDTSGIETTFPLAITIGGTTVQLTASTGRISYTPTSEGSIFINLPTLTDNAGNTFDAPAEKIAFADASSPTADITTLAIIPAKKRLTITIDVNHNNNNEYIFGTTLVSESVSLVFSGTCESFTTQSSQTLLDAREQSAQTYTFIIEAKRGVQEVNACGFKVRDENGNESPELFIPTKFTIKGGGGGAGSYSFNLLQKSPSFTQQVVIDSIISQVFKAGQSSPEILRAQKALNENICKVSTSGPGSKGSETSYFGPATQRAIYCFQRTNNLIQTGLLDQATKDALHFEPEAIKVNEVRAELISNLKKQIAIVKAKISETIKERSEQLQRASTPVVETPALIRATHTSEIQFIPIIRSLVAPSFSF